MFVWVRTEGSAELTKSGDMGGVDKWSKSEQDEYRLARVNNKTFLFPSKRLDRELAANQSGDEDAENIRHNDL